MKKLMAVLMTILMVLSLGGCKKDISKEEGYKKYQDMGIEFIKDGVWNEYDENLMLGGIGDNENEEEPIYSGLEYGFISDELIAKYYEVAENVEDQEEKSKQMNDIFAQVKDLHKIVVFRKDLVPKKDKIEEVTGFKFNEKIGTKDEYVFYFSYGEYDDSELSDKAKEAYKALHEDIKNFKKNIQVFKPITPEEAIAELGKVEFKLNDLFGEEVDSAEFFKNNKVTMINIWGTFCGPCIREMPDLQEIHTEMADEKLAILGIIGDTPDEENEKKAKELYEEIGITFKSIIPDENLKDGLISSIAGYPTTIFVDSDGNIIGETVTGSRSKEDYMEIINKILESVE